MRMDEKKELVKKQEKLRKRIWLQELGTVLFAMGAFLSYIVGVPLSFTNLLFTSTLFSDYLTQVTVCKNLETKLQLKEIELMEIKKNHGTAMQKKEKTTQEKTTREKLIENSQAPYSFRFNGRPHQYPSKQGTTNQTYTKNR